MLSDPLIRNQQVSGSSPLVGSNKTFTINGLREQAFPAQASHTSWGTYGAHEKVPRLRFSLAASGSPINDTTTPVEIVCLWSAGATSRRVLDAPHVPSHVTAHPTVAVRLTEAEAVFSS